MQEVLEKDRVNRPPEHKAQWWPEDAHVHVKKTCHRELLAGESPQVANGKLIWCGRACPNEDCNQFAVSVRIFDPAAELWGGLVWPDGTLYCMTRDEEIRERHKNGERPKLKKEFGRIVTIPVCLADLSRRPRKGYRWCGHKTSDKKCWCGAGFSHLREGDW